MEFCRDTPLYLSLKLDGMLEPEEARALEEHLACCPRCRALERELSAIHTALPELEEYKAPEGFARSVMERVADLEEKPKVVPLFRRPQVRALMGLAACAVLCVGLYRGGLFQRDAVGLSTVASDGAVYQDGEASAAGVRIDLLVRGNCSLVTGIPGVSDTIRIIGIIDRYLEHSRILIFGNGGEERYFIGSSDWMTRNLDNRIEVMAPVYDPDIQRDLKRVIEFGLRDTMQGHIVDGTGRNLPWTTEENLPFRSQEALYTCYKNEII